MRKFMKREILCLLLLTLFGLLLRGIAHADLKSTAVVWAWDFVADKYESGNATIYFNNSWVPFLHPIDFDNDLYPDACGAGTSTKWAGYLDYGVYHEDNAPAGAKGFQETREWKLVYCDRDGDGKFDGDDRAMLPPDDWTEYTVGDFDVGPIDNPVPCTSGHCEWEIVTTMWINLDTDCNGTIDDGSPDVPAGGLCFYAEALTPGPESPFWVGNIQGRVTVGGGGDKTVNFSPEEGPTAVTLASFTATGGDGQVVVEWETAIEVDNVGFNLWRRTQAEGRYEKINDALIPSKSPGSMMGASYSYVDDDVVNGTTYYYKLEDIDLGGRTTGHGPVSATPEGSPPEESQPEESQSALQLIAFGAKGRRGEVVIKWATAKEIGIQGFNLWRSTDPSGGYEVLNGSLIPSNPPGPHRKATYSYQDTDVVGGTTYYYRLEAIDSGGSSQMTRPVSAKPWDDIKPQPKPDPRRPRWGKKK